MAITVIAGPCGSGKSRYVGELLRRYCDEHGFGRTVNLSFRDTYGASDSGYYLQQRWNSSEQDLVPTGSEFLGLKGEEDGWRKQLFTLFNIYPLLGEKIITFSSGELRRFTIAKALLRKPDILVLDNPFIGLDAPTRDALRELLLKLGSLGSPRVVLVVSRECDIPSFADEIIRMGPSASAADAMLVEEACSAVTALPSAPASYETVVKLNDVSVRFGQRTIVSGVNWTVKAGEKWSLEGPNGAGKSTLLSIICADIPQAYACDVTLFDRQRGTGESIWDIKKHIGFVSPELHRAYSHNVPVLDVVASGLHDRQGLYLKTTPEQEKECLFWLGIFGIGDLAQCSFLRLSSGEQRMVLLARAFVKDPDLLILDEPFHGLDDAFHERVSRIIEAFCSREGKALIMVSHYKEDFVPCISHHFTLKKTE